MLKTFRLNCVLTFSLQYHQLSKIIKLAICGIIFGHQSKSFRRHGFVCIIISTFDFYLPYVLHTCTDHLTVILKQREPNRLCIDFEGEIVFILSLYEGYVVTQNGSSVS